MIFIITIMSFLKNKRMLYNYKWMNLFRFLIFFFKIIVLSLFKLNKIFNQIKIIEMSKTYIISVLNNNSIIF